MSVIGDTIHWYQPNTPAIEDCFDIRPQDVGLWTRTEVYADPVLTEATHWWGEEEPPLEGGPDAWLHPDEHVRNRVSVGGTAVWVVIGPHAENYLP